VARLSVVAPATAQLSRGGAAFFLLDAGSATDEDMLFLKQIGLRWVHAQFGDKAPYELIKSTLERLDRYGIKIHCFVERRSDIPDVAC
jgi:hypothetical protein